MTNRYWATVEASLTVNAPKSHVRPNITMSATMVIIVLMTDLTEIFFFLLCVTTTRTPSTKMMTLNVKTKNMGPNRVTKNTIGSLMKQLWRKIICIIKTRYRIITAFVNVYIASDKCHVIRFTTPDNVEVTFEMS